jgi:hypothetical protein
VCSSDLREAAPEDEESIEPYEPAAEAPEEPFEAREAAPEEEEIIEPYEPEAPEEPYERRAASPDEPLELGAVAETILEPRAAEGLGLEIGADDSLSEDLIGDTARDDYNLEAEEPLELLELAGESETERSLLSRLEEELAAEVGDQPAEAILELTEASGEEEDEEAPEEDYSEVDFLPVEFKLATMEHRVARKLRERGSGLAAFQVDLFKTDAHRKMNGV